MIANRPLASRIVYYSTVGEGLEWPAWPAKPTGKLAKDCLENGTQHRMSGKECISKTDHAPVWRFSPRRLDGQ